MVEDATGCVYYHGRKIAFKALRRILYGGAFSNIISRKTIESEGASPDDNRAAVNLIYGVLRNHRLIDEVLKSKSKRKKLTLSHGALLLARMAAYELLFMDKVPGYASVSEYMKMARGVCGRRESGFMNACLRQVAPDDIDVLLKSAENEIEAIALKYSHPEWLTEKLAGTYGMKKTKAVLEANNTPQDTFFRMNRTKISIKDKEELKGEKPERICNFNRVNSPPFCVCIPPGSGAFPAKEYNAGLMTAQDRSSQYIAYFAAPGDGERILDLCCGSGIKTTQLAELAPCASITASDVHAHKLKALKAEFNRLGIDDDNIEIFCGDMAKKHDLGTFDCVLLDAPCSGSGTLRRKPELKMRITEEDVRQLSDLQARLLDAAAGYVRSGGRIVYSTCSVLPEENQVLIEHFLDSHSAFENVTKETVSKLPFSTDAFIHDGIGVTFLPCDTRACGGYISVLRAIS